MSSKIVIVVAAIIAMGLGFWAATSMKSAETVATPPVRAFHGSMLSTPRTIGVPPVIWDDGSVLAADAFKNHWTLVFFGYTHCPDICPTTLNALAQTKKQAPENFPQVVFISVDPERDTVDVMGEYVQYFDPSFKGVTGEEKLIEALALQMGSVYMQMPASEDDENYLMDHSSAILVLNPEGKLVAYINPPHTPENILKALKAIQG